MRKLNHNRAILFLGITGMFLFLSAQSGTAQSTDENYGNTPDALLPYGNYQDAYKYHFTYPPLEFTGAGREKPEPICD